MQMSPDLDPTEHLWDVVEQESVIIDVEPTIQNCSNCYAIIDRDL